MQTLSNVIRLGCVLLGLAWASSAVAQQTEKRIALVVGNAAYQAGELATPANDAGLVAQTLQAAGFDVVGARDLDQDTLRRALRDFVDKAAASGPDTVAFIYFAGYGLQLEGENYLVPIDAKIARDVDLPAEAIRVSDYTRPLAALPLKARIVVLDAARDHPFAKSSTSSGSPLAGGLALVEPEAGTLIAFNAAPGTVAPDAPPPYGPYAQSLSEMMREGGLPLAAVFDRVRLRVNEVTRGAEVPWDASKVQAPFVFFERGPDAPPPPVSDEQVSAFRARPLRDLGAQDAYMAALERDTLQAYLDFLAAYPDDPLARRVRVIVAARREAITWRRTRSVDTPPAYWSYLRRYPRGSHAADARRRLAYLSAAFEPPPSFPVITYDVPPPPDDEAVYVDRPVLYFGDPDFGFAPPPPPPAFFLPPPPPEFWVLPPPPPPVIGFVLPVPMFVPVPAYVRPPVYLAPPPNNVIFNNIHNTVVINNTTNNTVVITNRAGQIQTITPPAPAVVPAQALPGGRPGGPGQAPQAALPQAAGFAPSLPPSVAHKAALAPSQPPGLPPAPGVGPAGRPPFPGAIPPAHMLPGQAPTPGLQEGALPRRDDKSPGRPLPGLQGQPPATGVPPATGISPATGRPPLPGAPPPAAMLPHQGPGQPGGLPKPEDKSLERPLPGGPGASPPAARLPVQPSIEQPRPQRREEIERATAPPPPIQHTAPPPPVMHQPPPPPPIVHQPPPPPPVVRQAPPPPPVVRPPPPPPVVHVPPPPPVARPAPPPPPAAAAKKPACGAPGLPACPK